MSATTPDEWIVPDTTPAWGRFSQMSAEIHEILIGAAQCRNHLRATLECWDEYDDTDELKTEIEQALERLTRVGI